MSRNNISFDKLKDSLKKLKNINIHVVGGNCGLAI